MTTKQIDALKLALENICAAKLCEFNSMSSRHEMIRLMDAAITAIREALAHAQEVREQPAQTATYTCGVCGVSMQMEQPAQQEPVAWLHPANATCVTTDPTAYARGIPLYTSPQPSNPWVGLTDEERGQVYASWRFNGSNSSNLELCRAIEARLKEKNT